VARLVGAKCPNCGAAVRVDPKLEWVTCDYCRTSSYVETPARKQAPNHPPAHIPVIRVQAAARGVLAIVLVATLAPVIIGGVVSAIAFSKATSAIENVTTPPGGRTPPRPPLPSLPPAPKVDYFANATSIPGAFQAAIGAPLRAKQLVIYSEYAIIEAQDPQKPQNVDRYTLRNGSVGAKDPVRLAGREKDNLTPHLFELSVTNFGLVPALIADARTRLAIEDAKVSHVMLDRMLPFSKDVLWRVYMGSDRDSGFVEYDTAGRMKRVSK
jgi:hypothetical protein